MSSSSLLHSGDYFIESIGLISKEEFYSIILVRPLIEFLDSMYSDSYIRVCELPCYYANDIFDCTRCYIIVRNHIFLPEFEQLVFMGR